MFDPPPRHAADEPHPRVLIIGTSCCGKTTFARALAQARGCPVIDLDDHYWMPGWQARERDEFVQLVQAAARGERWIAAGNYREVRPVLLARASTVVWLDLGFMRVLSRGVLRSLRRAMAREAVCNGNRESLRRAFLSHEGVVMWILATWHRRRREYGALRLAQGHGGPRWLAARTPREVRLLLEHLQGQAIPCDRAMDVISNVPRS